MSFSISIEAEYLCCASKPNKAFTPIFKMEIFAILINKDKNTTMKPFSLPRKLG